MSDESSSKIAPAAEPVAWTDDYALGVADIDQQHRALFQRVNAVLAAARSSDPQPALEQALGSLRIEAARHFAEEEQFMELIAYPGRDRHAAAHRVLIRHLQGVASLLSAGGSSASAIATSAGLLREWLLDHIVDEDAAVGAHARSMPASRP